MGKHMLHVVPNRHKEYIEYRHRLKEYGRVYIYLMGLLEAGVDFVGSRLLSPGMTVQQFMKVWDDRGHIVKRLYLKLKKFDKHLEID